MRKAVLSAIAIIAMAAPARADFCRERPSPGVAVSIGRPSLGALLGAERLVADTFVRVLPRQAMRCIHWSTPRLVQAIERAGSIVARLLPGSPPLGVGDLSRAKGGPIRAYSQSHQSGRDADLALYQLDASGSPVPAEDFVHFDSTMGGRTADGRPRRLDLRRNWRLVLALLEDPGIHVRWLFLSTPLRAALLAQAREEGTPALLLARAAELLHQPSDAPPHDDHLHLRIACEPYELARGCRD